MNADQQNLQDYGIAILRIALGAMFLAHGLLKVFVFTLPGTAGFFESVGFPGFAAYIVAPAEILAGIALLVGFRTRLVAAATIPLLLGALSVHAGNGWVFSNENGGWEYPAYLVVAAIAQALLGAGALSVERLGTGGVATKPQNA
ncbi:MAG: DoxX family protein [Rhodocyclaceae bacterium]|nr:DoxX family protein [Rhodocyclaceae bacterium]